MNEENKAMEDEIIFDDLGDLNELDFGEKSEEEFYEGTEMYERIV